MLTLLRIQNPRAFLLPDFSQFLLEALGTSPMTDDPEAALLEVVDLIGHEQLGLFVTREAGGYVGLALCENNTSALNRGCVVLHFVNHGSDESRKLLLDAIAAFAREGGNTKIWGFDVNCKPRGFARLFKALGNPVLRGELFEFDLTEGEV